MFVCLNCGTEAEKSNPDGCVSCGGVLVTLKASASGDTYSGRTLGDKYVLLTPLGRGGMGAVYKARHRSLDKVVAIKILDGFFQERPGALKRFYAEARNAARLEHPNNIKVFDFGHEDDGLAYIVMEMARGKTLSHITLPLGVDRTLFIVAQLAAALQEAHDLGLVHRDLKPDNVMLTELNGQDFSRVLDYGIAKASDSSTGVTRTGTIIGTPQYISPEQATGADIDHRSDIYSLGALMFELLTGRAPFKADNALGYAYAHANTAPPRPSEYVAVPDEVETLVLSCLAKAPAQRPQTMDAVRERIQVILYGENRPGISTGEDETRDGRLAPTVDERGEMVAATGKRRTQVERRLEPSGGTEVEAQVPKTVIEDLPSSDDLPEVASGAPRRWVLPALAAAVAVGVAVLALGPLSGGEPEGVGGEPENAGAAQRGVEAEASEEVAARDEGIDPDSRAQPNEAEEPPTPVEPAATALVPPLPADLLNAVGDALDSARAALADAEAEAAELAAAEERRGRERRERRRAARARAERQSETTVAATDDDGEPPEPEEPAEEEVDPMLEQLRNLTEGLTAD